MHRKPKPPADPSRPPRFAGRAHLKAWLRDHPEGQKIMAELARPELHPLEWLHATPEGRVALDQLAEQFGRLKAHVVVQIHADGYVCVMGDRADTKAAILHCPAWDEKTPAEYLAAMEERAALLPLPYRDAMQADILRAAHFAHEPDQKHWMRVDDAAQIVDNLFAIVAQRDAGLSTQGTATDETLTAQTQDAVSEQKADPAEAAQAKSPARYQNIEDY